MPAEKKQMTERERKRLLNAQKQKKSEYVERNENTQTNATYKEITQKYIDEKKERRKAQQQVEKAYDQVDGEDGSEHEVESLENEDEDHSTEASQDSDSTSSSEKPLESSRNEFLFSSGGAFVKYWNLFIILLAMYNSLFIPLQIFYKENAHSALGGTTVRMIDAIVDLLFLIDIIITFRTTFLDPKLSIEVRDPHIIGKRYLKGSFMIDLISSVPFTSIINRSSSSFTAFLDALGLLKLLRLSRLLKTVQRSNMAQDFKVYLKIIMMAIVLFVMIHVLSCLWFAIVSQQERWVQNMDFMYAADEDAYQGFFEGDAAFWRKYFVLLYTGFYVFGVGEVVPRASNLEFFMGFILCSLCTIFNAVIIGYMTSYMEELSKKTADLNEKLNLTNTAMLNLRLSPSLKSQIKQYIYQTHTTKQLQSELTNFMNQISPVYKRKVTKETFTNLVWKNSVLLRIKKTYMDARRKAILSRNVPAARSKLLEKKEEDKCITQLVVKLDSIFTSPDVHYLQQEDEAWKNPQAEEDEEQESPESFMYFIRNGKFSVHVQTDHLRPALNDDDNPPRPVTYLIDGDHFGEIGMIFESKRTATVKSENYGTLALLKRSHYLELTKTFDSFTTEFKNQIYKYQDDQSTWLMVEMDKIDYFHSLSLPTKQEIIYNMERLTYEKGSLICQKDVIADKLILIQQGIVEVAVKYDRRRDDQYFVIERLGRGALINHRSFMVADDADTDFVSRTTCSCFVLHYTKFAELLGKRQDLQKAKQDVETDLLKSHMPLALDYIFHNNQRHSLEAYQGQLRKNSLKVKLKNAIMQKWTVVKEQNQPGNISDMVDQMLKKKRAAQKDGPDYLNKQQSKEDLEEKIKRRRERAEQKQSELEQEAKDSYLNVEQFVYLQKNIEQAGKRLKEQQGYIDQMEKKMIVQIDSRRKKEEETMGVAPDKSTLSQKHGQYLQVQDQLTR